MNDALVSLAKQVAAKHGLEPHLVCAVVEQESAWDTFAARFEEGFLEKYIKPIAQHMPPTEEMTRSMSFGLMQLMGEVARELGFAGHFLTSLCDPATGLEYGCRHLKNKLDHAGGDVTKALLAWNGGAKPSYPSEVLARMGRYA